MKQAFDMGPEWAPRAQGLLRIIASYLFLQHGTAKFFGIPDLNMSPALFSLPGLAGVLEIAGGILMLIGLFTRPVAFILSGFMAVAYFMAHNPQAFMSPLTNGGELAVLYCFVWLFFFAAGPGAFSVDNARRRL